MNPDALTRLRTQLNWTPRRCARYLGVSLPTWKNWESGSRSPTCENAKKLRLLSDLAASAEGRAQLQAFAEDADARRLARRTGIVQRKP